MTYKIIAVAFVIAVLIGIAGYILNSKKGSRRFGYNNIVAISKDDFILLQKGYENPTKLFYNRV